MPAPTPLPLRQAILRRHQRGQTAAAIAQALGLSQRTVRQLLRRWRPHDQPVLLPAYRHEDHPRTVADQQLHDQALALRRQHPTWGAGLIRVLLRQQPLSAKVPTERTLQRWFHQAGLGPAPKGRRPAANLARAQGPHAVWQIDAKDVVRLRSDERISWLRIVDECSGAVLWTAVFPYGRWLQVPVADVQAELRRAFARWGRPATIRVDNGGPWGSAGDLPPDLALWLIGLGIDLHWNDAHRPQQNGVVERSQGTGQRWAAAQCATAAELQQRLQVMDGIQREAYPSIDGQSRAAAYPGLRHSGRRYSEAWERGHWEHRRVLEHLAGYVVVRRVDKNGDVSLYHRPHYVGCMHRGKRIYVMVDPERTEWVFADDQGRQLRSQKAEELAAGRIRELTVTKRR